MHAQNKLIFAWMHNYIPSEVQKRYIIHRELYLMTQVYLSLQVIPRLFGCFIASAWHCDVNPDCNDKIWDVIVTILTEDKVGKISSEKHPWLWQARSESVPRACSDHSSRSCPTWDKSQTTSFAPTSVELMWSRIEMGTEGTQSQPGCIKLNGKSVIYFIKWVVGGSSHQGWQYLNHYIQCCNAAGQRWVLCAPGDAR